MLYQAQMLRCKITKRHARAWLLCAPLTLCATAAQAASPDPVEQCIVGDHAIGCLSERTIIDLTTPRKDASALQQLVQSKLASGQCRLFEYGERVQVTQSHGSERTQIRRPGDKASWWIPASWSRPAAECEGTPTAAARQQKLGLPGQTKPQTDDERSFADDRAPSDERVASFAEDHVPPFADERGPSFTDDRPPPSQRWHDDDYDTRREHIRSFADRRPLPPQRWADNDNGDDDDDYDDDVPERLTYHRTRRPPPAPSHPLPSSRYAHHCDFKSAMTDTDRAACRNPQR